MLTTTASRTRNGASRRNSRSGRPRADEDTVGTILAELDRRAESVERRDDVAALVRHEELHDLEPRFEPLGYPAAERVETLAGFGRDLERAREAILETLACLVVDAIDLVEHELDRQLACADLRQHALDGLHHQVDVSLVCRRVDDVQDEVGDQRLFQCGREALDELVRQPADEADGVGQEVPPALVLERPGGRVERLEEAVVDRRLCARERVQQRRLADVGVAGEGDGRRLR